MKLIFSAILFASAAFAEKAPVISRNPVNAVAVADFPESGPHQFTKGYVFFSSNRGRKVKVNVDMTGLPPTDGPFYYHIHENAIGAGQGCEAAGNHFDPYGGLSTCPVRGEKGDDSDCIVGDLSGKHGWINATCFQTDYTDAYLSLNPDSPAYVVGRSVVFHYQNLTAFACANINIADEEQMIGLSSVDIDDGANAPATPTTTSETATATHGVSEPLPKISPKSEDSPALPQTPADSQEKAQVSAAPDAAKEAEVPLALPSDGVAAPTADGEIHSAPGSVTVTLPNNSTSGSSNTEAASEAMATSTSSETSSATILPVGGAREEAGVAGASHLSERFVGTLFGTLVSFILELII